MNECLFCGFYDLDYGCVCYDLDFGCTCPSVVESELPEEDFKDIGNEEISYKK